MMKHSSAIFLVILLSTGLSGRTITKINSHEAYTLLNSGQNTPECIIDGRSAAMFASGHIENAVKINAFADNADEQLIEYLTCTLVMVYCTNQRRAETIIDILKNLGYQNDIIFITDGINGWKANGYKIISSKDKVAEKPTKSNETGGKLSPIVQVFGAAAYDVENEHYGYSFGRAHLGFQYEFNKAWSAKMIIDRGRPTTIDNISVSDSAGNMLNVDYTTKEGSYYTMWLKFASLKWQVNDRLSLIGGALLQNHFITQERFWGLRYVAQTFQDMYWHIPSSDLGFRANYKLNDVFSIDAAITNGEGPRIKQDAFGKVKYAAGLNINPGDKFRSRIYYHAHTATDNASTEQMASVFAGYHFSDKFRLGGEFNYMNNIYNANGSDSYGFSVYSVCQIFENTDVFIRYDRLLNESDNTVYSLQNGNSFIGGISWSPVQGIKLSLNYQGWLADTENTIPENNILLSMEYTF